MAREVEKWSGTGVLLADPVIIQVSVKSADFFCSNPAHKHNERTNDWRTDLIVYQPCIAYCSYTRALTVKFNRTPIWSWHLWQERAEATWRWMSRSPRADMPRLGKKNAWEQPGRGRARPARSRAGDGVLGKLKQAHHQLTGLRVGGAPAEIEFGAFGP